MPDDLDLKAAAVLRRVADALEQGEMQCRYLTTLPAVPMRPAQYDHQGFETRCADPGRRATFSTEILDTDPQGRTLLRIAEGVL